MINCRKLHNKSHFGVHKNPLYKGVVNISCAVNCHTAEIRLQTVWSICRDPWGSRQLCCDVAGLHCSLRAPLAAECSKLHTWHSHKHTHTNFNGHFPSKPWSAGCPLWFSGQRVSWTWCPSWCQSAKTHWASPFLHPLQLMKHHSLLHWLSDTTAPAYVSLTICTLHTYTTYTQLFIFLYLQAYLLRMYFCHSFKMASKMDIISFSTTCHCSSIHVYTDFGVTDYNIMAL